MIVGTGGWLFHAHQLGVRSCGRGSSQAERFPANGVQVRQCHQLVVLEPVSATILISFANFFPKFVLHQDVLTEEEECTREGVGCRVHGSEDEGPELLMSACPSIKSGGGNLRDLTNKFLLREPVFL